MKSKEYKEFLSKDITRKRLTFQTTITGRKYALYYGIDTRWREKLKDDRYEVILDAIDKLGQYEDIEQELGIDLITLFKAYTDGFYVKGEEEKQHIDFENSLNATAFKNKEMFYGHKWSYQYVKLYDYGKTWALTIEELENDKH